MHRHTADTAGWLVLLQCVGLSEPQHEHLLRHVLEQQQEMLSIQQSALLDSTSGAGGQQQPSAPQLQLRPMHGIQQQQQQQGWGALDALELPDEFGGAAGAEEEAGFRAAHERTGSWVAQHNQHQHQQQQQQQQLLEDDQCDGAAGGYPGISSCADPGGSYAHHGMYLGNEQDFDRPLAARLPAGAIVSSSPAAMMPKNSNSAPSTAVFRWMGEGDMAEDDRAAVAAAAAYAAVPDPVKPNAQRGSAAYGGASYSRSSSSAVGRQSSRQSAFASAGGRQQQHAAPQTVQELAGAMYGPVYSQRIEQQWQHGPAAAAAAAAQLADAGQPGNGSSSSKKQVLPGIDEIESVLAAYSAAGVFPGGQAGEAQTREPLLHFMMAPQHAAAGDGAAEAGGAVLYRAPPQVTAVAQVCVDRASS
jgi:hypothetical protein